MSCTNNEIFKNLSLETHSLHLKMCIALNVVNNAQSK